MLTPPATLSLVCLVSLVLLVAADSYNPKYDDFDIDPLLENDRILVGYAKCFLSDGPCTPDAKDFKKIIPEALESSCGKCTPKQKHMIRQVAKAMMDRHPDAWEKLVTSYDPNKKYRENFDKFIHEED